jgi:hypothetical protein
MSEHLLHVMSYEQACLMPSGGACDACASNHEPHEPHNAASRHYHEWFAAQQRELGHVPRQPTWRDAAEHCDEPTRERWQALLESCGINASMSS